MNGKLTLLPVAAAGGIGLLFGAGLMLEAVSSTEEADVSAPTRTPTEQIEVVPPTPSEPFFEGELLGIRFADEQTLQAEGFARDDCPDSPQARTAAWTSGETSFLPPPSYVPANAVMPPERDIFPAPLPNPGYMMCPSTGEALGAWRYYEFPKLRSGVTPYIYIAREVGRPVTNAPHLMSDVHVIDLADQKAVQIGAAELNDYGEPWDMIIHIPLPDGMVTIHTMAVAYQEGLKVAESVTRAVGNRQAQ